MDISNVVLWIFCIYLSCLKYTEAINYPECGNIERFNTFVASHKNCAKYIFCDGENSFEGECLGDNYFNEVKGNCDDRSMVICRSEMNGNLNSGSGSSDNENDNDNSGSNNNDNNGNINNNDNNNDVDNDIDFENNNNESEEDDGIDLDLENQQQSTPLPLTTSTSSDGSSGLFSPIPLPQLPSDFLQTPQCDSTMGISAYLPNPTSCSSYYTCYNGIAISMVCNGNQYFNVKKGKCEHKDLVECTLDRPVKLQCVKGIYDFLPHPRNCQYYYFCSNGFLLIYQCPFNYTWNYEKKTCVHQTQSKCFSSIVQQEIPLAKMF